MASTLVALLHTFLDMYERDPMALDFSLGDDGSYYSYLEDDDSYVPPIEQLELLLSTSAIAEREVLRKTLIRTSLGRHRYEHFRSRLSNLDQPSKDFSTTEMLERLRSVDRERRASVAAKFGLAVDWTLRDLEAAIASQEGLTYLEYKAKQAREIVIGTITANKLRVELLRFFADRLDSITDAIEKLDDTDFSLYVPESLAAPFRELHVNAVLGNYGTVAILCGAVLEQSLRDLLPTGKTLNAAIEEAKECELLINHALRYAYKIMGARNEVVHGTVRFDALTSDATWELLVITRTLVRGLYQARMEEAN